MSDPQQPERPGGAPRVTPGDPLGGSGATPFPPPDHPAGYRTPPPPGAGGPPRSPSAPYGYPPGSLRLASWWRRVGAAIIDGVIIGILAGILLIPLGIGAGTVDSDAGAAAVVGAFLVTLAAYLVIAFIYAPVMMSRTNGQTLGRMATRIRVVRTNGQRMTFAFAAVREILVKGLLVGVAGNLTFGLAYLIDVLWPLWDEQNRALHDMVVKTRVVEA